MEKEVPQQEPIDSHFIEEVCVALAGDRGIRQKLPGGGVLNIDRLLPFLCLYRRNPKRQDLGTRSFVDGEAAYLSAPGDTPVRKGLAQLVRRIAETAAARYGAYLIIEVWSGPDLKPQELADKKTGEPLLPRPGFRVFEATSNPVGDAVNSLRFALEGIQLRRQSAEVEVQLSARSYAPGSRAIMSASRAKTINCFVVGLEVRPVYRDARRGIVFPKVLAQLRRHVGRALRKSFFTFTLSKTCVRPQHFYVLGRQTLPGLIWEVDHRLAEVGAEFDLLLQATPINAESSWKDFEASGFLREPEFQYRPLAVDPLLLKRQLNLIPTERIADATISHLLRQTQEELDRVITMLSDVGTRRFLPGSVQVFGGVEDSLLELARELLIELPSGTGDRASSGDEYVDAREIARRARREIRAYRRQHPGFTARVEVREDMYSGMMASRGNLLIGRETRIPARRVEALLAHEVGAHLVTYYNGLAQPLRLLSTGLAAYDVLQEGLAVLSEFLVGGLSRGRLRMLAARVVATHRLLEGGRFSETYRLLTETHGFEKRSAYTISMRVYRGGGLTKDAVYLRGLVKMLDYLRRGGAMEPVVVGKLAVEHIPIIRELLLRKVLREPPLTPRFMNVPRVKEREALIKEGCTIRDLIQA